MDSYGQVTGSETRRGNLQIGFGEKPKEWTTVHYTQVPVNGVLGLIPVSRISHQAGRWSIRSLVEDSKGQRAQALATVNVRASR